jgi:homoserine O-acetyltransferase
MKPVCLLVCILLNSFVYADSPQLFAEIGDFQLQSGEVILNAKVGYRLAGVPDEENSNIIIMPTWHTGTTQDLFDSDLIGPGKLANTDRYFVVAIDALGNGVSSSPSTSTDQSGSEFPDVSIADMVNSQYETLSGHLGIKHVTAVIGMSMGAMQTLQWAGKFPGFMDKSVSIEGSPKMTSYDLIQWRAHVRTIELMRSGGIDDQAIMSHVSHLNLLTLWTPEYFVNNLSPEDLDDYLTSNKAQSTRLNPDNYLVQTRSMMVHDVLGLPVYQDESQRDEMLGKLLMIGFDSDHMVNPEPAKALSALLGTPYVDLSTNCGHMGTSCKATEIADLVHAFLK